MGRQAELNLWRGKRGGRRPGSGRKRIHSPGVAHRQRERMDARTPVHVNFKLRAQIRNKKGLRILKRAIVNARRKGLRVAHYSLQSNHVHLILEAQGNDTLTRGMRSLTVTFAKGLKAGRVQPERYHLHVLKTVRETKNAVRYVLLNQQRHTGANKVWLDGYSSLGAFPEPSLRSFLCRERLAWDGRGREDRPALDPPAGWLLARGVRACG